MTDIIGQQPPYDSEKDSSGSLEKPFDHVGDTAKLKNVEESENWLGNDEASDNEYRVENACDVAVKSSDNGGGEPPEHH
ncbi:hypothetical protein SCP_0401040 [Sparassis crispa]|uniref:Uncharacterized protein n=1 Tax=Sparassis crispa TaxID=139825 RepID=A0A401GHY1_9APHY|nr:hypothetical protein SCP_0401040 [Sparassis crispa]GBE81733.1 hypothetical protein SCP_0401040 [Sparassis crispa]